MVKDTTEIRGINRRYKKRGVESERDQQSVYSVDTLCVWSWNFYLERKNEWKEEPKLKYNEAYRSIFNQKLFTRYFASSNMQKYANEQMH